MDTNVNNSITLEDVNRSVLISDLAYFEEGKTRYDNVRTELKLDENKIKPFYKNDGTKAPAGYVIEHEGKIIITYHGTMVSNRSEIYADLNFRTAPMKCGEETYDIHKGFINEYHKSQASLAHVLQGMDIKDKSIEFTGHSLGAAMATIAALDFTERGIVSKDKVKVINFGSPRIFATKSALKFNSLIGETTVQVQQKADPIVKVPPSILGYKHVGRKIKLDVGKRLSTPHLLTSAYAPISKKIKKDHIDDARISSDDFSSLKYVASVLSELNQAIFNKIMKQPLELLGSMRVKVNQAMSSSVLDAKVGFNHVKYSKVLSEVSAIKK